MPSQTTTPPTRAAPLRTPIRLRSRLTTASISTTETLGSGTNLSHAVLCPGRSLHIGEDPNVDLAVSTEFALEANQIAIRVGHRVAFDFGPRPSIVVLQGIA